MSEIPSSSIVASGAYRLFLGEVERYLTDAQLLLSRKKVLSQVECVKLGAAFHTIRGSSGFFGLTTIAAVSQKLEALLMDSEASARFDHAKIVALVAEIQGYAQKLPRPAAS